MDTSLVEKNAAGELTLKHSADAHQKHSTASEQLIVKEKQSKTFTEMFSAEENMQENLRPISPEDFMSDKMKAAFRNQSINYYRRYSLGSEKPEYRRISYSAGTNRSKLMMKCKPSSH